MRFDALRGLAILLWQEESQQTKEAPRSLARAHPAVMMASLCGRDFCYRGWLAISTSALLIISVWVFRLSSHEIKEPLTLNSVN